MRDMVLVRSQSSVRSPASRRGALNALRPGRSQSHSATQTTRNTLRLALRRVPRVPVRLVAALPANRYTDFAPRGFPEHDRGGFDSNDDARAYLVARRHN